MAYGGGTFNSFNKDLLGVYYRSVDGASLKLANRGYVAMMFQDLGWSPDGVYAVSASDFNRDGRYLYLADTKNSASFMPIREVAKNANVIWIYNSASGGTKASNDYCTAKYTGSRGNNLNVVISQGAGSSTYDVELRITVSGVTETVLLYRSISSLANLPENNFVDWEADAVLTVTAGTPLTGGVDKTAVEFPSASFLTNIVQYNFDVIVYASSNNTENMAFASWVKDMRDMEGRFIQGVAYNINSNYACMYSVAQSPSLCYWVAGIAARSNIKETIAAIPYDGENRNLIVNYSPYDIRQATQNGQLIFHDIERGINPEATVFAIYDEITNLVTPSVNYEPAVLKQGVAFRVRDIIRKHIRNLWFTKYSQKVHYLAARNGIKTDVLAYFDTLKNDVIQPVSTSEVVAEEPPPNADMDENLRKRSTSLSYPLSVLGFAGILYVTEYLY